MKLGQESMSGLGKLQVCAFSNTVDFKFEETEIFLLMVDFHEKYQIHSGTNNSFRSLYRRRVKWCFTVFITLNILLRLENILLFRLIFINYICGSVAVR